MVVGEAGGDSAIVGICRIGNGIRWCIVGKPTLTSLTVGSCVRVPLDLVAMMGAITEVVSRTVVGFVVADDVGFSIGGSGCFEVPKEWRRFGLA